MPERKGFDLGDYVEVKDRIRVFYESYGGGRLVTSGYELTNEPDGKPKVIVTALAYRSVDDPHPGVGTSWMYLPGKTSYTAGSEIENVETSAWGRAIGSLGILIDRSIASQNEIDAKAGDDKPPAPTRVPLPASTEPTLVGPFAATGQIVVRKTGQSDGNLRQGPDGGYFIVAFVTTDDERIPQVLVRDPLATDLLDAAGSSLNGLVCTIEGDEYSVPFRNGDFSRPFRRIHLERITTAGWSLPEPAAAEVQPSGQAHAGSPSPEDEAELDATLALLP